MTLSWKTRLHVWFRLLVYQANWNYERLQGLGFFFALLPALRKLYAQEDLPAVCREHASYFNTHPYLAPLVAGVVLKMEEQRCSDVPVTVEVEIAEYKEMVAAPYAAIGDAFFWGGLRPLTAGIALFLAAKGILWAPLVFLLLFNLLPFWFRTVFFRYGYKQGLFSLELIQRYNLPDWAIRTKEAAVVVLGGLTAFLVFTELHLQSHPYWLGLLTFLPMILLGMAARKGVSTLVLLFVTVSVILLLGIFWTDVVQLLLQRGS